MVVGACRVTLMIPESHSLKEKRAVLTRIKDRTRQQFNLAIAEVGDQDAWQSAQIGFAVVANERGFVQTMVERILRFIEELAVAKVVDDEKDFVSYGEGEPMDSDGWQHWEPEEPSPMPQTPPGRGSKPRRGIPVRGSRRK